LWRGYHGCVEEMFLVGEGRLEGWWGWGEGGRYEDGGLTLITLSAACMQVCFHNLRLRFPDQASGSRSSSSAVSSSRCAVAVFWEWLEWGNGERL